MNPKGKAEPPSSHSLRRMNHRRWGVSVSMDVSGE